MTSKSEIISLPKLNREKKTQEDDLYREKERTKMTEQNVQIPVVGFHPVPFWC